MPGRRKQAGATYKDSLAPMRSKLRYLHGSDARHPGAALFRGWIFNATLKLNAPKFQILKGEVLKLQNLRAPGERPPEYAMRCSDMPHDSGNSGGNRLAPLQRDLQQSHRWSWQQFGGDFWPPNSAVRGLRALELGFRACLDFSPDVPELKNIGVSNNNKLSTSGTCMAD